MRSRIFRRRAKFLNFEEIRDAHRPSTLSAVARGAAASRHRARQCLATNTPSAGGGGGGATQKNQKKTKKKQVPNLKFAVAFGFFGLQPPLPDVVSCPAARVAAAAPYIFNEILLNVKMGRNVRQNPPILLLPNLKILKTSKASRRPGYQTQTTCEQLLVSRCDQNMFHIINR